MKVFRGWLRFLLVTVGIIMLTSVTIDATTSFDVSQSALGILAREATSTHCPDGMTEFVSEGERRCVDRYEVSVGALCPNQQVTSITDTRGNISAPNCTGESVSGILPWTSVTYHQAREVCALRGSRLPTHAEWYNFSLATPDSAVCNIDSTAAAESGSNDLCLSGSGVYDAVGNVWEWIAAEAVDGVYDGRSLPETGYVSNADSNGVALSVARDTNEAFTNDYFWSNASGTFAMMRGGFYGSGEDAGLYSIHADIEASFAGNAIGFRCVKDI